MIFEKLYSYDDVLMVPNFADFLIEDISLKTRLIGDIYLNIPIVSAAMDTITEYSMALGMSRLGGVGVIHRNMPPEAQVQEIIKMKNSEVDLTRYPLTSLDTNGKLLVGAAVSPHNYIDVMPSLVEAAVDFVVFDVAHSDSKYTLNAITHCKKEFMLPIMGGNVATPEATRRLIDAGADAVKIGVGAGSICTTRIICGIGIPQLSANLACSSECHKYNIPCISDGGLRYSGDIVKALGSGANAVMLGNMLAIAYESAGETIENKGQLFKKYRGMGSMDSVIQGGSSRYQSEKDKPVVPEGVEGVVPCGGNLDDIMHQITTGIKKGMWYCGQRTLHEMNHYKRFIEITPAGLNESHAHDIMGIKSVPNYHK